MKSDPAGIDHPAPGQSAGAYAYAHLGGGLDLGCVRLRGVGVANMLFPWARYVLARQHHGLRGIAPTWRQIAHRQWLQPGEDKRWYGDLFQPLHGEVTGLRKLWLLSRCTRVPEEQLSEKQLEQQLTGPSVASQLVVFAGLRHYFEPLWGQSTLIRRELFAALRPSQREHYAQAARPEIAVHVRLGDFTRATAEASVSGHVPTGMDWFVQRVLELQEALGPADVSVFSDGTEEQLRPLLALPGVRRQAPASSIVHILLMSDARVLVGSGGSTFSAWASYLGQQPTVWRSAGPFHEVSADLAQRVRTDEPLPHHFLDLCVHAWKKAEGEFALSSAATEGGGRS